MRTKIKYEAIIGTILVHLLLLVILSVFAFTSKVEKKEEGVSFEIDFEQIQELQKQAEQLKDASQQKAESNKATNTASDFEERKPDYKSFEERAQQELDQEIKDIVESVRGDNSAENDLGEEMPSSDEPKEEKTENQANKPKEQKASEYKGKTNISYALENRFDTKLKVPVYMCEGTGVVVIDVDVDRYGFVKSARVDKKNSSKSFCLQKAAEMAAKKSRFNSSESNPDNQKGTITYSFVAQ